MTTIKVDARLLEQYAEVCVLMGVIECVKSSMENSSVSWSVQDLLGDEHAQIVRRITGDLDKLSDALYDKIDKLSERNSTVNGEDQKDGSN